MFIFLNYANHPRNFMIFPNIFVINKNSRDFFVRPKRAAPMATPSLTNTSITQVFYHRYFFFSFFFTASWNKRDGMTRQVFLELCALLDTSFIARECLSRVLIIHSFGPLQDLVLSILFLSLSLSSPLK